MLVSQILANKGASVITVGPSVSAVALAQLFKTKRIGAAVVVGDHDEALGIVAERDIVHAIAQYTKKALKMRAHNLMQSPPTMCRPNDNLKDVMAVMINRRVRHVVAIEGNLLCGIVSIGDVLKPHLDETALEINVLRDYAQLRVV